MDDQSNQILFGAQGAQPEPIGRRSDLSIWLPVVVVGIAILGALFFMIIGA